MADMAVDTAGAVTTNGGTDPLVLEPKQTVLAREDSVSGNLALKGPGQVLGIFSGQIECDGDLLIGPEAQVEADIRGARITVAGLVRGNVIASNRLKITSTGRLAARAAKRTPPQGRKAVTGPARTAPKPATQAPPKVSRAPKPEQLPTPKPLPIKPAVPAPRPGIRLAGSASSRLTIKPSPPQG